MFHRFQVNSFGSLASFSAFPFEAAHHNLLRKCSRSVSPKQLTEVIGKRFLRDFYRKRVPRMNVNDFTFNGLLLKNCQNIPFVQPNHPFYPLGDSIVKSCKHFVFDSKNYHCHDENCNYLISGNCCNFVCYLEGENLKYGMLQSILFDMTNQSAVIGVEEFAFNYCDFASGSSDSAFKNCLNSLGITSFVSKLVLS